MSIQDLHICNSLPSESSETANELSDCIAEYFCYDICQENAFSVSTAISWQHFPRSTSSRSRCDDSEEIRKSISETRTLSTIKEEAESVKASSSEYPITKSFSQLNALHYLEVRHVVQFFNFLLSHLICNEPEDPVEFLVQLLSKCLNYRDSFGDPPQLFTQSHLKSVYNAFDPFERGHLTLNQYKEAMKSIGLENSITPYNHEPSLNEAHCVSEDTFMFEAERCLTENLKSMLRIPSIWEENRLTWKKKMAKKMAKKTVQEQKKEEEEEEEEEEEVCEESQSNHKCSCSLNLVPNTFCRCSKSQEIRHEPEQLFLN